MNRATSWNEFDAELSLIRHLVHDVPWRTGNQEDRGLKAEFRRWDGWQSDPTTLMLAPLWRRVPSSGWKGLDESSVDRSVHHAAMLLHLQAMGEIPPDSKSAVNNLGTAARQADVKDGRFARLMNTPGTARLKALSRLFRQFRQKNVRYRLSAPKPTDGVEDERSTLKTLRDNRRDDLAALLAFLFTDNPKASVSRWAAGYYRADSADSELPTTN